MPKLVKTNRDQRLLEKQEVTETFILELTGEDIDLAIGYILRHEISTFLKLRRMSDPELSALVTENYRAAVEEAIGEEETDDVLEDNNDDYGLRPRDIPHNPMSPFPAPNPYPTPGVIPPMNPFPTPGYPQNPPWDPWGGGSGIIYGGPGFKKGGPPNTSDPDLKKYFTSSDAIGIDAVGIGTARAQRDKLEMELRKSHAEKSELLKNLRSAKISTKLSEEG
jgi:hypothetical protein